MVIETGPMMNESYFFRHNKEGTTELMVRCINSTFLRKEQKLEQLGDQKENAVKALNARNLEEAENMLREMMYDPTVSRDTKTGYYTTAVTEPMDARKLWKSLPVDDVLVVDDEYEMRTIGGVEGLVVDTAKKQVLCNVRESGEHLLTMADVHAMFSRGIESLSVSFDVHTDSNYALSAVHFHPRMQRAGDADDALVMPYAIARTLFSCDRLLKGLIFNIDISDTSPFESVPFDTTGMQRLPRELRDTVLELRSRLETLALVRCHFVIGEVEAYAQRLDREGTYEFRAAETCLVLRVVDCNSNCAIDSSALQAKLPELACYFPELKRLEALARLVCLQRTVGELARASDKGPANGSALALASRIASEIAKVYNDGEGGEHCSGSGGEWIKSWAIEQTISKPIEGNKRLGAEEMRRVLEVIRQRMLHAEKKLPTLLRNTLAIEDRALQMAIDACKDHLNDMVVARSFTCSVDKFATRLSAALRARGGDVAMQLRKQHVRDTGGHGDAAACFSTVKIGDVIEKRDASDGMPLFIGRVVSRHLGYVELGSLRTVTGNEEKKMIASVSWKESNSLFSVVPLGRRLPTVGERVAVRSMIEPRAWLLGTAVDDGGGVPKPERIDVRLDNGVLVDGLYPHEVVVWDEERALPLIDCDKARISRVPDAFLPNKITSSGNGSFWFGGVSIHPILKCVLQAPPPPSSSKPRCTFTLTGEGGTPLYSFPPNLGERRQTDGGAFFGWKSPEKCKECAEFKDNVFKKIGERISTEREYQLMSIRSYTNVAYMVINQSLMKGRIPNGMFRELCDFIRDPRNSACPPGVESCFAWRKSNVRDPQAEGYVVGKKSMTRNFTSASTDRRVSSGFKTDEHYFMKIEVRADSKYAAYIGEHSMFPAEKEILFMPSAVFEVVDIDHDERVIYMRETSSSSSDADSLVISQLSSSKQ